MRRCIGLATLILSCCAAAFAQAPKASGCAEAAYGLSPEGLQTKVRSEIAKALAAGEVKPGDRVIQSMLSGGGAGGVVRIGPGCYEVTGTLTARPGLRIVGAGPVETILFRGSETSRNKRGTMFRISGRGAETGKVTQVSGISFVGVEDPQCRGSDYGLNVSGVLDFRVDHCYFERFGFAAVNVNGVSRGVVDHCSFKANYKDPIRNLGYGVVVYRSNLWEDDMKLGSREATFVEDCVLVGCRHAVASNGGAHYVFRRNHVRGNVVGHAVDAHGLGYGSTRGTRCVEIYENLIEDPAGGKYVGIGIRGGDGVIFSNTVRGYRTPVNLSLEGGAPAAERTGYPRKDQVRDLWAWGNTPSQVGVSRSAADHIKKDRDYFEKPKPDYKPFAYPHPLAKGGPFDKAPEVVRKPGRGPGARAAAKPETTDPEAEKRRAEDRKAAEIYRSARQAERAGMAELARTLYERLIKEHPGSKLAEKARKRIGE